MSEWTPRGYRKHHHQYEDVYWCECDGRCSQDAVCDCCELADLRAEVERLTAALADRDATIQRVRDELQGVTVALAQGCLCHGDVCSGKCGRGTPWAWNLDPERITAALRGGSDE